MKSVILSERTKPRALEQMKDLYEAHSNVCKDLYEAHSNVCKHGVNCRVMVKLKAGIEAAEALVESKQKAKMRSVGVK